MANTLTKEQALVLAPLFVQALRENAKSVLDGLDDEDRKEMHPQAFAALETLSGVQGDFCKIWPQVDRAIDSLGWLAKMFLGGSYALVLTLQTIGKQIAAVLCKPGTV